MADNNPEVKVELEKPATEQQPKQEFNIEELLETAKPAEDVGRDESIQEDKTQDNKDTIQQFQKEADKNTQQTGQNKQEIDGTNTSTGNEEVENLRNQLKFYQTLYGDQPIQQQQAQQPQVTQQEQQQQQRSILDSVQLDKDDLYNFLSGEPEKALPVLKKFMATAVVLAQNHIAEQSNNQQRVVHYVGGVQKAFYDKYPEMDKLRPLVKIAGDQLQQEMASTGRFKYPHELIDDIAQRTIKIREQMGFAGNKTVNNGPRKIITQGEVGGTRLSPPSPEKVTEQQKEMFDLLED